MNEAFFSEELGQAVSTAALRTWSGTTYRHTAPNREALSGDGARLFGGRWNPPGVATLYLAQPRRTALDELQRLASSQSTTGAGLIAAGRVLHTIEVVELPVLDLTDPTTLEHVGLTGDDIADESWAACQAVGQAADFLDIAGLLAPSATGSGLVLAVFEHRAGPGRLRLVESRKLTLDDLSAP